MIRLNRRVGVDLTLEVGPRSGGLSRRTELVRAAFAIRSPRRIVPSTGDVADAARASIVPKVMIWATWFRAVFAARVDDLVAAPPRSHVDVGHPSARSGLREALERQGRTGSVDRVM